MKSMKSEENEMIIINLKIETKKNSETRVDMERKRTFLRI